MLNHYLQAFLFKCNRNFVPVYVNVTVISGDTVINEGAFLPLIKWRGGGGIDKHPPEHLTHMI